MTVKVWPRVRGSVRLRITLIAAGVFAVTMFVASFALLRALERALVDDLRAGDHAALLAQRATVLAEGLPPDILEVRGTTGTAVALPYPGTQRVIVYAPGAADLGHPGTFIEDVTTRREAVSAAGAELLGIEGDAEEYEVSTLPVGGLVLATASPLDAVRDTLASTQAVLWVVGPALVALVAGLAWLLAGRALRPVHAVTSRVAAITSHSLHERVPEPSSADEISELARTMNGMLGRLESATTSSRRLVSDASHELRTPVAVMRTELEVVRRSPEPDWEATAEVLQLELDRLQGLVDDLLLLARSDEQGVVDATMDPVSMVDLVHEVTARPRRVAVEVGMPEVGTPSVPADAAALRRAVDHLVANATRHARARVRVTVEHVDAGVRLHVDDDGPGIPARRRADVTRRFVRLDAGRSRDGGGAGLGLAVSADVARSHGGHLEITDSPLGGARVSLILPGDGQNASAWRSSSR